MKERACHQIVESDLQTFATKQKQRSSACHGQRGVEVVLRRDGRHAVHRVEQVVPLSPTMVRSDIRARSCFATDW
jgi:hypothetical protein